jgi:DNA-binding response OmpR family regulator
VIETGGLRIDLGAKSVTVGGEPVDLKPREFALLACLALRPGRVMSRVQIEEQLYGETGTPASNSVDSAVCSLRRSLGETGTRIKTRRGLGYVLEGASP